MNSGLASTGAAGGAAKARAHDRHTLAIDDSRRRGIGCGPARLDPERTKRCARAGLNDALAAGSRSLQRGGSAVDAVEAAVRVLEEDELLQRRPGQRADRAGLVELDAAIMDGRERRAGAVSGIRRRARRSAWLAV